MHDAGEEDWGGKTVRHAVIAMHGVSQGNRWTRGLAAEEGMTKSFSTRQYEWEFLPEGDSGKRARSMNEKARAR